MCSPSSPARVSKEWDEGRREGKRRVGGRRCRGHASDELEQQKEPDRTRRIDGSKDPEDNLERIRVANRVAQKRLSFALNDSYASASYIS